jgi:fibronectin type 3 domain-containing protein
VTQTGEYQIAPLYATSGFQALRVQRTSSSYLTLEYRQSGPFDVFSAGDPEVNGVTVRVTGSDANRTQSQLVDMTPATTSFTDAALLVGATFMDPLTNVSMTTLATSSVGADVRISFVPDETAPSQPGGFKATALDPYRIGLSWTSSTDNIGVAGYRITRNATLVGTVTGTSYTDAGLLPSTAYNYQIVAFDAGGNSSTGAAAGATTLTPDLVPPTAPTVLTATLGKGSKVALSWKASTDAVGVAGYRVYKNGQLKATVTATGYNDTLGGGKNPSASYYVVAFDAAGNVSAQSNTVLVGQ